MPTYPPPGPPPPPTSPYVPYTVGPLPTLAPFASTPVYISMGVGAAVFGGGGMFLFLYLFVIRPRRQRAHLMADVEGGLVVSARLVQSV